MNSVNLIGRLCTEPILTYSQSGIALCKFTLAVDRPYSKEKQADFLPILCFKATAENSINYLAKGSKVGIIGSIQTSTWEKDGVKHYKTEILAERVEFLDSKQKENNSGDDIPF